jgi:hypothetical protein
MVLGVARSVTKKRYREQVEDHMAEMSSMSESEIRAAMEGQEHKKQDATNKFLDFHRIT